MNEDNKKNKSRKAKIERFVKKTLSIIPINFKSTNENIPSKPKQHIATRALVRLGSFRTKFTDRCHINELRNAIKSRDSTKLKALLSRGLDIHIVISDVFWDTPLTFAVKCGYLDIVELLLKIPGCKVDHVDRYHHSVLDEAVTILLKTQITDSRKTIANRYRIIKCLLLAKASIITPEYVDAALFSVLNNGKFGRYIAQRLVKVVGENGVTAIKSKLFCLFVSYHGTASYLKSLLKHGCDPSYIQKCNNMHIPIHNARIITQYGLASRYFLERLHCLTTEKISEVAANWTELQLMMRYLVQSQVPLRPSIMNYIYQNHATFYKWIITYEDSPKPLLDLCRHSVRCLLKVNVMHGVQQLNTIPDSVKLIILMEMKSNID